MELQILTGHTVHIKHTVKADFESTAASLIRTPQLHWVLMQIQLSPHTLFLSNATHTSSGKQGNTNIRMKDPEDYGVVECHAFCLLSAQRDLLLPNSLFLSA